MVSARETLQGSRAPRALADRVFFGTLALYCGVTILGGFVPTFYLRDTLLPGASPLRAIVLAHGAIFTTWVLLYVVQTALISADRRVLHRRLGLFGGVVVAAMALVGYPLIGAFEQTHGVEPALVRVIHLFGNVAPLTLFVGFAAFGLWWRRRADTHKRLMLFATMALQPAGFSRLIGWLGFGQALNVPAYAVLCATVAVYDLCVDGRVRPVSIVGGALLFGEVYVTDLLFAYIGG